MLEKPAILWYSSQWWMISALSQCCPFINIIFLFNVQTSPWGRWTSWPCSRLAGTWRSPRTNTRPLSTSAGTAEGKAALVTWSLRGQLNRAGRRCPTMSRGRTTAKCKTWKIILKTALEIGGWYFRLVSGLQRSLWNENQFVNHVKRLSQNELVHVYCLEHEIKYLATKGHFSLFSQPDNRNHAVWCMQMMNQLEP